MTDLLSGELVRSVLDSAPDAMIIIDASGTVLFANHQITALFGHAPERVIGNKVEMLLPERFRSRHVGHRTFYAHSGRVRPMGIGLDLFALRADGNEFPVEISLSPIQDGPKTLVAAAIRDVSDRMRVERELKQTRADADRANLAKSRFLATASHDLRQPLQSLALLNGSLRRMVHTDEALEALAQQESAIGSMSRLLNALLDISKLESGAIKPDLTDFRVAALFDEMRTEFAGLAASKGLQLTIDPAPDNAHSDPSLVAQILRNLLANAIKYTPRGTVCLRCQRRMDVLRIEVHDSGIGIPEQQFGQIFEEFYQVGVATNASREGYGLGLSIVQRLVQLLGLHIDVRSRIGVGSTFSLTLPVAMKTDPPSAPVRSSEPRDVAVGPARHVLLVEDDPGVRKATQMFLKGEGYRVTSAATPEEALLRVSESPDIDLIISDFHLGNGALGTDVIAALRGVLGPAAKAVVMTGDTSSLMRNLPCDVHLRVISKPINANELLSLTRELLLAP